VAHAFENAQVKQQMTVHLISAPEALARLADFSSVIDARSESEFAEDHLPAALNWPSLSDEERKIVGTEYKQISGFDAKKIGSAMVARNVAAHIEREVVHKPKNWQPLVYCWRGGKRSGTLAWFLDQIGFKTSLIEGGYKAFRAAMVADLARLAPQFEYRVVCGKTGSGKTRLLQALSRAGAQVLDLEDIAHHRGSVLGLLPGKPQPSQKHFEMRLWERLHSFSTALPVFVESESKKIGNLRVPEVLIDTMRERGNCLRLELPDAERVRLLLEDYAFFQHDVPLFHKQLDALIALRGRERVETWKAKASAGDFAGVFLDLMHQHYDPAYTSSIQRNFKRYEQAQAVQATSADVAHFDALAQQITQQLAQAAPPATPPAP
jgi:tRNA 2-selenouridine synthase